MKLITLKTNKGFSLVEVMIVSLILLIMIAGIYLSLSAGQDTWLTTNTSIEIQESLRLTLEKISKELRESGSTGGVMQITLYNDTGVNSTDIVRFSMPVVCQSSGSVIAATGDVAYWRAPLTWGCTNYLCMDADNNCNTVDYSAIEYLIDNNNRLVRRVLNNALVEIRRDIFASNITNFQASLSADWNVVTIVVTASQNSAMKRNVTVNRSLNIFLRNRG